MLKGIVIGIVAFIVLTVFTWLWLLWFTQPSTTGKAVTTEKAVATIELPLPAAIDLPDDAQPTDQPHAYTIDDDRPHLTDWTGLQGGASPGAKTVKTIVIHQQVQPLPWPGGQ